MSNSPDLYKTLKQYTQSDYYPFHMPGHKRQTDWIPASDFPNPYQMDITEIEGFDNLHYPQGIILRSMDWTASVYGADKTYYLINGSSGGILSAISAAVPDSGTILMSRNCHKAAYHGVFLNSLKTRYVYPQYMEEFGVQCGLSPENIEIMLKTCQDISAVFLVSPTYDGIVSDIKKISQLCHMQKVPLIVDEAHGAHFRYGDIFPVSALDLGADIVIQSVHKTLPCFTQSALLHLREGYVDRERIEKYLQIYQTSSPSYLLMSGIEQGIWWMEQKEGQKAMKLFSERLENLRTELKKMKHLTILGKELVGTRDIYDLDISKIIISTKRTKINGVQLCDQLRRKYHLEMEMCTEDYVTAITTIMDTQEGLDRLKKALLEIDGDLEFSSDSGPVQFEIKEPEIVLTIKEAWNSTQEMIPLKKSIGKVAAEFIYLYPPGIPVVAPGERITEYIVETVFRYKKAGLSVQGMKDSELENIVVVNKKS